MSALMWQVPGDLDPALSPHHLTTHKAAYLKLRFLVDSGAIFVGHGLKKDFRMLNIVVPPAQARRSLYSVLSDRMASVHGLQRVRRLQELVSHITIFVSALPSIVRRIGILG